MKPRDAAIPVNVRLLARVKIILRRAKRTRPTSQALKRKLKQLRSLTYKARDHAYAKLKGAGVSRKQADTYVETFEEGQRKPEKMLRPLIPRVREDLRLVRALKQIIPAGEMKAWLDTPNRAFAGKPPAALLQSRKRDAVWKMIRQIKQGMFS